jgi:hypothetical protein
MVVMYNIFTVSIEMSMIFFTPLFLCYLCYLLKYIYLYIEYIPLNIRRYRYSLTFNKFRIFIKIYVIYYSCHSSNFNKCNKFHKFPKTNDNKKKAYAIGGIN